MNQDKEIEAHYVDNTLHVNVTNIREFKALIEEALKRAEALQNSLRALEMFQLKVEFSTYEGKNENESLL